MITACLVLGLGALFFFAKSKTPEPTEPLPRQAQGELISTPVVEPEAGQTEAAVAQSKPAAVSSTQEKTEEGKQDYQLVTFEKLASFEFDMSEDVLDGSKDLETARGKAEAQIPDTIKSYNQQAVALQGFMLPLKVEGGLVTEFLIMRDQSMCCFGTVPKINEWVSVKMSNDGVKPVMDQPVTIYGKLHVGDMRENGYLVGIYKMDGDKLAASN